MNDRNPDEWDWGLCTIELGKALEGVLRRFLHPPLGDDIRTWWFETRLKRKRNPTAAEVGRMDIGDYAAFLNWAGPNRMWPQLLRSRFQPEHAAFLSDLPSVLTRLNEHRNHAAHAGAKVKEPEAKEMHRQVIGTGESTSLIARLVHLAPQ